MTRVVRRVQAPAALAVAAGLLVLASVLPLAMLVAELFSAGAFAQLQATLGTARPWTLFGQTAGLAALVTAGALAIGVPMGVLIGKTDVAGARAALLVHLFPVFVPPFLLALGWFHLLGREGLFGTPDTADMLFSPLGVLATLALAFAPVVTALTVLGLHGIEASLEEAARTVSRPLRVVTHILVPLAWPAMAFGALVVFALALSEIGVPMFLRVQTYPAAVFARLGGVQYAPGEAVALVLPMLGLGLLLVLVDRRLLGRRSFAALGLRSSQAGALPLGALRPLASVVLWVVCALSILPFLGLAVAAGAGGIGAALDWVGASLGTSLLSAAGAATVIASMGLVLGRAVARRQRCGLVFDAIAMLAFLTPASVLGVGLMATWNHPFTQVVYASSAILVVGLVARYATVGVRTFAAVFHRSPPQHEEAAAVFGAGFLRRLACIVIPMQWRSMVGAWLVAFVFCMRDLDTVVLFYPPGSEPLPVRIFTLEANGPAHVVAGLSILHVAATASVLALAALLLRAQAWGRPWAP